MVVMMNIKLMNLDIKNIIKSENEYKRSEIKEARLKILFYLFVVVFLLMFLIAVPIMPINIVDIIYQFIISIVYVCIIFIELHNLWEIIKLFRKVHFLNKDLELLNSSDNKKICDAIFKSEKQKSKSDILFYLLYNPDKILSLKFIHTGTTNLQMEYVDNMCVVHTDIFKIDKKIIRTDIPDITINLYNEVVYYPYHIETPSVINVEPQVIYEFQKDIFELEED